MMRLTWHQGLEKHRVDEAELKGEEGRQERDDAVAEHDAVRKQEWMKLPYSQRVACRRLHQRTGHASTSAMAGMLRVARAPPCFSRNHSPTSEFQR